MNPLYWSDIQFIQGWDNQFILESNASVVIYNQGLQGSFWRDFVQSLYNHSEKFVADKQLILTIDLYLSID